MDMIYGLFLKWPGQNIGTGAGLYFNRGKIIDMALDKVKGEIPSLVKGSLPSLPTKTGLPSMPRF